MNVSYTCFHHCYNTIHTIVSYKFRFLLTAQIIHYIECCIKTTQVYSNPVHLIIEVSISVWACSNNKLAIQYIKYASIHVFIIMQAISLTLQQIPEEFVELTSAPLLSNILMTSSWPNNAASVKGVLPEASLACRLGSPSSSTDKLSLSLSQINENIDMSLLDRLCKAIALLSTVLQWHLIRNISD